MTVPGPSDISPPGDGPDGGPGDGPGGGPGDGPGGGPGDGSGGGTDSVGDLRHEIEAAYVLLRRAGAAMDRAAAREEGWPVPFAPVRWLILARIHERPAFGVRPARLARFLELGRSTISHHLGVLEAVGMVERAPLGIYDSRNVAVRLTERGLYGLLRMESELRRSHGSSIL